MANRLKMYLVGALRELVGQPLDKLVDQRYEKFRRMGKFLEGQDAVVEAAEVAAPVEVPAAAAR
jgi:acetyl-CoA carboxylase carboxyl transferase subunit alpha